MFSPIIILLYIDNFDINFFKKGSGVEWVKLRNRKKGKKLNDQTAHGMDRNPKCLGCKDQRCPPPLKIKIDI